MSKDTELTIVSNNPAAVEMLTLSASGVRNVPRNRYYTDFMPFGSMLFATTVDGFIEACPDEGLWQVHFVQVAHTVVGGAGATVQLVVCPQAVAIASGIAQLAAAVDLTVTAPAKAMPALITTPTHMNRGDWLGIDVSGTLTGLVGRLSGMLKRVG